MVGSGLAGFLKGYTTTTHYAVGARHNWTKRLMPFSRTGILSFPCPLLDLLTPEAVYALDATTIDLCLSLFSWAPFRTAKAAIKLHTLMDLRGSISSFIHISDGKLHNVKVLDILAKQGYIEVGAYYVMDKLYVDFARLYQVHTARAFFVTRAKSNMQFIVAQALPVLINTGLISDQHIDGIQAEPPISRADSTSHLHRSRNWQDAGVFDQQHDAFCVDYLRTLQTALAGRVVFQMDQTASAHQGVLWHNGKRSQDSNMDCHRHLPVDRHCQKAFELGSFFVRNTAGTGIEYVWNHINICSAGQTAEWAWNRSRSYATKPVPNVGTLVMATILFLQKWVNRVWT